MRKGSQLGALVQNLVASFGAADPVLPARLAAPIEGQFILKHPHIAHTIAATKAYIASATRSGWLKPDYIETFLARSVLVQALDNPTGQPDPAPLITLGSKTHPDLIVDLAKFVPADSDGTLTTRAKFIGDHFKRGYTFGWNIDCYVYTDLKDAHANNRPGALWAIRRACRALQACPQSQESLIADLATHFSGRGDFIRTVYADYLTTPSLGTMPQPTRAPKAL